MAEIQVPKSLHDVFGERQTVFEIASVLAFAIAGTLLIYWQLYLPTFSELNWKTIVGFVVIADVLAGCVANFTKGTNQYYAARPSSRFTFIAIHFHIVAIAWLLESSLLNAWIVWGSTITAALIVNALKGHRLQLVVAANLLCYGLLLLIMLPMEPWFLACSLFFMLKVVFSFAVDHYTKIE
ncbi:hypothetical protein IOC44_22200 [Vibrio vulnificus]|uniref:hypothetical protein n=1 Tax=Vibrio vulnificus TaxID=672 RepID=UPI001A19E28B|nr:hypothetical protein [Vibrio vulnificus]MCD1412228.1 hypothetical protein [Vibrio vulnificus]MCD1421291.1 hypothetical protein [Vibrio vulnificus]MCD1424461.1 hypothetical protein [Vibrio vulnificus]MCD1440815.1 hypothetical protein [Vibrio vulnificus]MCD1445324.1 hypothetical protein [Vibrio vulnificus]